MRFFLSFILFGEEALATCNIHNLIYRLWKGAREKKRSDCIAATPKMCKLKPRLEKTEEEESFSAHII